MFAIVPAYNEEKTIGLVVQTLLDHVDNVIVVDDGSSDNTSLHASNAGAVVLRHLLNRGQGAALQTGHEYAVQHAADFVLHFDGDGQFDACDIVPALDALKKNNADILLGSRFLDNRSHIPWFKRCIILPCSRLINRFFVDSMLLTDVHNGFRILNKNAFGKICLIQDRMAHATEICTQIAVHELKYIEFPVKVVYTKYGQGFQGGLIVLKDLVLSRFVR